jgi:hypothetical protein
MFRISAIRLYEAGIWLEIPQWVLFKLDTRRIFSDTIVRSILDAPKRYVDSTVEYLTKDMYARAGDIVWRRVDS